MHVTIVGVGFPHPYHRLKGLGCQQSTVNSQQSTVNSQQSTVNTNIFQT
ncbi:MULTISPECIES: hypothetical protein [Calothrix]|uniref:Uncharacterized protein n=2 Tax=Calothrix TaxID=1186 RepID=A0ABR8AGT7_9CYAN|nr:MULTISPECIES: hypothetical protein [Calothrix]MBD2199236.1 hypothetical protein [Calothrix parietina FACHB-288]MBD2227938.1 hypothetical protein [Calothrix anomala FACHB-343]